jgi:hypothetical protein
VQILVGGRGVGREWKTFSVRCGTLSNSWRSSQLIDYILVVYKCMVFIVVQNGVKARFCAAGVERALPCC